MNTKVSKINQKIEGFALPDIQSAILQGIANSYLAMYFVNLKENMYAKITATPEIHNMVSRFKDPQTVLNETTEHLLLPEFQKGMKEFVDLKTLPQRLKGKPFVSHDYKGKIYGWSNAKFLPVSYDENGELKEVIYAIEYVQERKNEIEIYKQALESNADFIYHFDLTEGIIKENEGEEIQKLLPSTFDIPLPMEFDEFIKRYFKAIGWQPMKENPTIFTIAEMRRRYEEGITRFQTEYYAQNLDRYYRSEFFLTENEGNKHITVMVVRTDITKEYLKELENKKSLEKAQEGEVVAHSALMAFAEPYLNVYIVDFSKDLVTIIKTEGYLPQNQAWLSENEVLYGPSIEGYIQARVAKEDQDFMRKQMKRETIAKNLENQKEYSFAYHVVENDQIHDFECRIIRTKNDSVYVFGFTNIDSLLAEEKSQKEFYRNALEERKQSEIYLEAISDSYDFLVISNLTKNTFTCPVNSNKMGWTCPTSGSYEELIENMLPYFPKKMQKTQRENRTIKKQFERYYRGENHWEEKHPMYDSEGNLHWMFERIMYTEDKENGDLIGVTVASVIDEEVRNTRRTQQITTALARDYTNVYIIKPMADEVSPVVLNGFITKGLNKTIGSVSPYRKMVESYANARLAEEERKKFCNVLSAENIEAVMVDRDEMVYSYQILTDGEFHDYQMKVIKTGDVGTYIFGFKNIDDLMAEQRKRQKQYQDALEVATRASQAKTDFLARMSHDIRTPINGIVGMSYIMEKEINNKEKVRDGILKVKMLTNQLEMLINDVLEMSRIESGKIELTNEMFDLQAKLQELQPTISVVADNHEIYLKGSHFDIVHNYVVSSPVHVQRIVSNIMTNAIKYNRHGGSVECWLKENPLDAHHSLYEFKIQDTGIGMSKEFLKHIFEPFSREKETFSTDYSGTGLGMAITKELVDMFGGTIEIESELDVGTTVTIRLPLELAEELIENAQECQTLSFEGKRVLLVEDNKVNLKFVQFLLEEEHAIVDVAMNGKEALETFENGPIGRYDLILMDVMMPIMDGLEATRHIRDLKREDAKAIPILAMSANAFHEDVNRCLEAGMNEHIAKPLNIEIMKMKIAKYL